MMGKWQSVLLVVTLAVAVSAHDSSSSSIKPYTEAKLVDSNDQGQGSCTASAKGTLKDLGDIDTACQVSWSDDKKKVKGTYSDSTPFSSVSGSWSSCHSKTVHSETIHFADKEIGTKAVVDHCGQVTITVDVPADLKCEKKGSKWVCKAQLDGVKCDGKKSDGESQNDDSNTPGGGSGQGSSTPPKNTTPPSKDFSTPGKQSGNGQKGSSYGNGGGKGSSNTPNDGDKRESPDSQSPKNGSSNGSGSGHGSSNTPGTGINPDHGTTTQPHAKHNGGNGSKNSPETPTDKPGKGGEDDDDDNEGDDDDDDNDDEDCEDGEGEDDKHPGKDLDSGNGGSSGGQTYDKNPDGKKQPDGDKSTQGGQENQPVETPGKEKVSSTPGQDEGKGKNTTPVTDKPSKKVPVISTTPPSTTSTEPCDENGNPIKNDGQTKVPVKTGGDDNGGEKQSPEPKVKSDDQPKEKTQDQPKEKTQDQPKEKTQEQPKEKSEDKPKKVNEDKSGEKTPEEGAGKKTDSSNQPEDKSNPTTEKPQDKQTATTQQCDDVYGGKCPEGKVVKPEDDGDSYGNQKREEGHTGYSGRKDGPIHGKRAKDAQDEFPDRPIKKRESNFASLHKRLQKKRI